MPRLQANCSGYPERGNEVKAKDRPSHRAALAAIEAMRILRVVGLVECYINSEIKRAFVAGYRHGRKMKATQ